MGIRIFSSISLLKNHTAKYWCSPNSAFNFAVSEHFHNKILGRKPSSKDESLVLQFHEYSNHKEESWGWGPEEVGKQIHWSGAGGIPGSL